MVSTVSTRRIRHEPLEPGELIARRFCAEKRIAQGAMGEVWAAAHTLLHLRVALKVLRREAFTNSEIVARFSREAFLLGQIRSDHVARVIDFVSTSKHGPVLVMEFIDGPSLAHLLRSKTFNIEEAIDFGIEMCTALHELHGSNVVHRDLKPANVMLQPLQDGNYRPVFVDLGVSRQVSDGTKPPDELLTEITTANRAVGTIEYMAPEQILSSRDVTPSADIYALGCILFRAVSGQHVYGELTGMDLARIKLTTEPRALETNRTDRVAKGFEELVSRTLARSSGERYETADEMRADLLLLRDMARRATVAVAKPSPPRRSPWMSRSAFIALGLAAGLSIGAAARWFPSISLSVACARH